MEEMNYIPLPSEVWNNCSVFLIRCEHFCFFVVFRDEIKYIICTYKVLEVFFFTGDCAFNKWLMIKRNLRKFGFVPSTPDNFFRRGKWMVVLLRIGETVQGFIGISLRTLIEGSFLGFVPSC